MGVPSLWMKLRLNTAGYTQVASFLAFPKRITVEKMAQGNEDRETAVTNWKIICAQPKC